MNPGAEGTPAWSGQVPLQAGNWTLDEWRAAEAVVFEMRSAYKPDALSAIYSDIAVNLQCKLAALPALTPESITPYPDWKSLAKEWEEHAAKWRKVVTTTCILMGLSPAMSAQESMDEINAKLSVLPLTPEGTNEKGTQ